MAVVTPENEGLRLAVRYLVLSLVAAVFVFPLIFMVVSSLKPDPQLLRDTGSLRAFLPVGDISLDNYCRRVRACADRALRGELCNGHGDHRDGLDLPLLVGGIFLRLPQLARA